MRRGDLDSVLVMCVRPRWKKSIFRPLAQQPAYPKHGVGKITAIEKAKIGDIDIHFYKILVEK